jgi:nitrogen-specific signal transduction histidine kinase/ActR/RegA family two-component response regulator
MSWYVCRLGDLEESRPEVLCLGYDISERRRLQQQLLQTQKLEAVGTLAAGIAHDFNNVLWGILGYSELAMVQINKDVQQAQRSIRRVLEAGNRAKYMVQQILQFSRQTEINMGPLDLKSVLKEVVKLLQATVPSNFEIQLKMADDIGWVHADATQIHQVVMNLSTNAYHAMQPHQKGVMQLSLDTVDATEMIYCHSQNLFPGRYVRMRISDTGEGIDPENYTKIFDPYFTTKGQGEGTGLGLAVSFGIIKAHGGGIQVESRKGKGTEFIIYLPEKEDAVVTPVVDFKPIIGGSEHVLLVDDEASLVEMTEEMLKRLGYRITGFSDSEEAWAYFADHSDQFDVVITDMAMPRMTGLELAAKITAHTPGIPIVICTGFSERIYQQDLERSGISMILKKPLMQKELAAAIRRVLAHSDAG